MNTQLSRTRNGFIVAEWRLGGGVDFHNKIFNNVGEATKFAEQFIGKNLGVSVYEINLDTTIMGGGEKMMFHF